MSLLQRIIVAIFASIDLAFAVVFEVVKWLVNTLTFQSELTDMEILDGFGGQWCGVGQLRMILIERHCNGRQHFHSVSFHWLESRLESLVTTEHLRYRNRAVVHKFLGVEIEEYVREYQPTGKQVSEQITLVDWRFANENS